MTKKHEEYVRICPKCHSSDISADTSQHGLDVIGQISTYSCNNCGFSGSIFPEVAVSDTENNKTHQKQK